LCNDFSKKHPEYFLISEIARVFGVERIRNKTLEIQLEMMQTQMNIESHHDNFISDRSLLDFGIYSEDVNCISMCQYYMINRYDLIFYLPCNIPLVDDGFRNLDDIFRHKIDKEFKKYMPIKTIPIMSLSREARVKEIERYL
jgi:hypothetical protein